MSIRIESGFKKGRTGPVVQDASKLVLVGFLIFAVSTVCVTLLCPLLKKCIQSSLWLCLAGVAAYTKVKHQILMLISL